MPRIRIVERGNFKNTESFLNRVLQTDPVHILRRYGELGVQRLAAATPKDTGLTSSSWSYSVDKASTGYSLSFSNSNTSNGIPVAILIQYGHGTRGGTYVEGIDYINPALRPIFEEISNEIWKEVTGR